MVPRMTQRYIREILFSYINNQSAIFYFRSFNCSTKTANWENWWSKLYSRKQIYTLHTEKDSPYFLYSQINLETYAHNKNKIFLRLLYPIFSVAFSSAKLINLKNMTSQQLLLSQHWPPLYYQYYLKYWADPSTVTVRRWQPYCTAVRSKKGHEN